MAERRARRDWTDEEFTTVTDQVIKLLHQNPKMGQGKLLTEAQKVLPPDRRRAGSGWSQFPSLLKWVHDNVPNHLKVRLDPDSPLITGESTGTRGAKKKEKAAPLPHPAEIKYKELEAASKVMADRYQETFIELQKLKEAPPPPTRDEILQSMTLEELIVQLMDRWNLAFTTAIAAAIAHSVEATAKQTMEEQFHGLSQRMHNLQNTLHSRGPNGALPLAPSSTLNNPAEYMPSFVIAGGNRQDFQRLQVSLVKANVRLSKVDLTKPLSHITLPVHDMFVVWADGTPREKVDSLMGKSKKATLVNGTLNTLQQSIINYAKQVRENLVTPS